MATKRLAFGIQKGGVGKTTSAICTARALADQGKKVLLVDLDPQANLTMACGIDTSELQLSTYDLLTKEDVGVEQVVVKSPYNFDLLPAHISLASAEVELVQVVNRERLLREKFDGIEDDESSLTLKGVNELGYDYVITDSPPSLGLLTLNVLTASDFIIIPLQCQFFAVDGLKAFNDVIDLVRRKLNRKLRLAGVLLTMHDARTIISKEIEARVRQILGDVVFPTRIGNYSALVRVRNQGPIQAYEPRHQAAQQYNQFAQEVIQRVEK
ncbi:MAG: Soj [Chloroflexi bacterium]|jgi:chromosome partitioning protein|nr:Soj [Chloroflexota bacterium]